MLGPPHLLPLSAVPAEVSTPVGDPISGRGGEVLLRADLVRARERHHHPPSRRGRPRAADVPRRQPHRGRLRRPARRHGARRRAAARVQAARPRARRPRAAGRLGARPDRARARGRRGRLAARPGRAAAWCSRAGPGSSTACAGSSGAPTTSSCKPFSYPELRGRVRGDPAADAAAGRARAAAGRRPRGRPVLARGAAARAARSTCRRRSSRCCARWRRRRRACSRRRSCCATCGASARWARRGRSTRTPAGCGRSSGRAGDRFVVNVWGVGYRLVDGPDEAAA